MTSVVVTSLSGGSTGEISSSGIEGSTGSSGGSGSSGGTGVRLDVGDGSDVGASGCKGKIDFLFVVSRSGYMGKPHEGGGTIIDRLLASAPEFLATMQEKFADFDVHVLVAKGDNFWGDLACEQACPGPLPAECQSGAGYPCGAIYERPSCDWAWGAGVVFNAGRLAPNEPCDVPEGQRYITSEQENFAEAFSCILQVGASGGERVLQALAMAVDPVLTGPGRCNEGFLRDDALLVVTFVTDMLWDVDSAGTPKAWAQAVLDAKGGDASSVVMLYIGAYSLEWCAQQKNNRACDFIEHFPYRAVGFVLEPTYGPAFDAATDLVGEACAAFIPQ